MQGGAGSDPGAFSAYKAYFCENVIRPAGRKRCYWLLLANDVVIDREM